MKIHAFCVQHLSKPAAKNLLEAAKDAGLEPWPDAQLDFT